MNQVRPPPSQPSLRPPPPPPRTMQQSDTETVILHVAWGEKSFDMRIRLGQSARSLREMLEMKPGIPRGEQDSRIAGGEPLSGNNMSLGAVNIQAESTLTLCERNPMFADYERDTERDDLGDTSIAELRKALAQERSDDNCSSGRSSRPQRDDRSGGGAG